MFMGFFWLLFLVIIIIGIVYFVQSQPSGQKISGFLDQKEDPLEILKVRYAKGEITKKQFEQMKEDLKK